VRSAGVFDQKSRRSCFSCGISRHQKLLLGKKKGVEIQLDGDLFKDPLPLHAVAVQGTIDRVDNRIVLRNPHLMESKSAGLGWMLWTVLGVGLIFGWRKMREP
jgi:hypothetical protein